MSYTHKVLFRKASKTDLRAEVGPVESIRHVSEERALAWIEGIKANCDEWEFAENPVVVRLTTVERVLR